MAVSPTHNGWRFDRANGRLDFYYRGTRVAHIDANGLDTADSKILNNQAQVTGVATNARLHFARSQVFDLDNGAGTTIDDVILRPDSAITITSARIVYSDATTGTVAAGSAKVGTTVGGGEIVAATNYENTKAVGTTTAMSIVAGAVAAGTPITVRHTGVAATQAGKAHVEITYTVDA